MIFDESEQLNDIGLCVTETEKEWTITNDVNVVRCCRRQRFVEKSCRQKACFESGEVPWVTCDQVFVAIFSLESVVEHLDDSERLKRPRQLEREVEVDVGEDEVERTTVIRHSSFSFLVNDREVKSTNSGLQNVHRKTA